MSVAGPIIIIEDDPDDQQIISETIQGLHIVNATKFFINCEDVYNYLLSTPDKPFIILSDVNLPLMSGTELKARINKNDYLRKKSIPFIFFTTSSDTKTIDHAYEMMVQGYFEKEYSMETMRSTLKTIIEYWKLCKHPN